MSLSQETIRIGVYGVCIKNGMILMVKTQSGSRTIYNFPGGAVEDGEHFARALERECCEELGCPVAIGELFFVNERVHRHPEFGNATLSLFYSIVLQKEPVYTLHGARWFALDALPIDMMLESDKEIIHRLRIT